jgi:hypothetical protein
MRFRLVNALKRTPVSMPSLLIDAYHPEMVGPFLFPNGYLFFNKRLKLPIRRGNNSFASATYPASVVRSSGSVLSDNVRVTLGRIDPIAKIE